MDNFWKNIVRYPLFFISSMIGLILVILKPLINFIKTSSLKLFIVITIIIILLLIIQNILVL
jgi:uncharacterized membrane protein